MSFDGMVEAGVFWVGGVAEESASTLKRRRATILIRLAIADTAPQLDTVCSCNYVCFVPRILAFPFPSLGTLLTVTS